jgi:hypothetical protein
VVEDNFEENMYAGLNYCSSTSKSVCFKILFRGFEISVACDDSCGALSQLSRTEVRVFREGPGGEDVTDSFFGPFENTGLSGEDLFKLMGRIAKSSPQRGQ